MQTHGGLINLPNHLPSWLFPECVQGIIFPLELSLSLFLFSRARSSFSTSHEHSPFCSGYIFSSPLLAQLAVQGRNLLETSFLSTSSPLRLPFNLFLRPVPAPSFSKFKAFLHFLNVLSRHFFLVYQRVYFFVNPLSPFSSSFPSAHIVFHFSRNLVLQILSWFFFFFSSFSSSSCTYCQTFSLPFHSAIQELYSNSYRIFFIFLSCFSFFPFFLIFDINYIFLQISFLESYCSLYVTSFFFSLYLIFLI